MDQDDIFIGLPYVFKMQYDEIKHTAPKLEEYYEKIKRSSETASKDLATMKASLEKIREQINELFEDISANEPRSYKDAEKSQ